MIIISTIFLIVFYLVAKLLEYTVMLGFIIFDLIVKAAEAFLFLLIPFICTKVYRKIKNKR